MEYHILHIEDSKTDADLIKRIIQKSGINFSYQLASDEKEVMNALTLFAPNIVLCDHSLPAFNSKMAYELCKEKNPELPFILVTGAVSEEFAVEMLKMGVDDYLLKSNLQRLPSVLTNVLSKKEAEQKLSASLKEIVDYKFALDQSSIVAITDQKGIITYVNDNFINISKYSRAELIGQDHRIISSGYHSSIFIKNLWVTIANGKIWKGELKNKAKDGTIYWVDTTIVPFLDNEGKPYQYMAIRSDITERKKADEKLIESDNRMRLATSSAGMGIWYWDNINDTMVWDKKLYQIYDITESQLGSVYEGWLSRLHPEDKDKINEVMQSAIADKKTEYSSEFRIIWSDLSIHYIKGTGITEYDDKGNVIGMMGVNWDVTVEKEKEQQLKLLESVITNTNDSVIITDAESFDELGPRILYVNDAFTKMTGYTAEEVLGKTPRILQGPKSDRAELKRLSEEIRKWQTSEITVLNYKKNGEEYWANFSVSPVANKNGWYTHWISIERDVTEQKLTEIKLKELNQNLKQQTKELALSNDELEQFAFVVSHDLQEPLRMITSFLTLLEKKYGNVIEDKGKKYIDFAVDGAKRMRLIILDLLAFSRIGKSDDQMEEFDLNELLTEIKMLLRVKIAEKEANIKIDQLPKIHGYRTHFYQVFQNLISNSLKYSVKEIPVQIDISCIELKKYWQFSIKDNGIGIAKEYFESIFIIFQRLHAREEYSGTGMGLAITKKIIETQGGTIWLESEDGKGSVFYFTVPKKIKL